MAEDRFQQSREAMVVSQLEARGIVAARVLAVFRKVPRHSFVAARAAQEAYNDYPLSIGWGQTISQPYMVALMTQYLELTGNEKVLEIGTGSGYQTAILAELAQEVYTVERSPDLTEQAARVLQELGYKNIRTRIGDGSLGWPEYAPYQGILVTAGAPRVPETLKKQLAPGGRLVIPVGDNYLQKLLVLKKAGNKFIQEEKCGCVFVPLIGREGWLE